MMAKLSWNSKKSLSFNMLPMFLCLLGKILSLKSCVINLMWQKSALIAIILELNITFRTFYYWTSWLYDCLEKQNKIILDIMALFIIITILCDAKYEYCWLSKKASYTCKHLFSQIFLIKINSLFWTHSLSMHPFPTYKCFFTLFSLLYTLCICSPFKAMCQYCFWF